MPTTTMTIFEEVFAVAKTEGIKDQLPAQTEQDFLFSIAMAIGKCDVKKWDALSPSAQQWYDKAVHEHNATRPIPEPTGYRQYWKVPPLIIEVPTPITKQQPKIVVQDLAVQAKAIVAVSKAKPKPEGVVSHIRKTIILNPDWTTRKVHEYLVANGWPNLKLDVVAVNAGDIRKTVEMVKELGLWRT